MTGLTVTGPASSATPGATAQFVATVQMSNSTTQTVTGQAVWQSTNGAVATVSAGAVTAIAVGEADIRATYSGANGSAHITVVPVPPATPTPTPTSFTLTGRVTEQGTGTAVGDVRIVLKDRDVVTSTNSSGNYTLTGLAAGNYTLRASKSGYTLTEPTFSISANRTLDFTIPKVASTPTPTPSPAVCAPRTATCGQATAVCGDGSLSCSQNRSGNMFQPPRRVVLDLPWDAV